MDFSPFHILLVDTDEDLLSSMAEALSAVGYHISIATNAKQAIQIAIEQVPHLVMMEVNLPEIDGIELCHQLRQHQDLSSCFFVFCTLRNEDYSQLAAYAAGADDYIVKPIKNRVLISRLKALLKRHVLHPLPEQENLNGLIIDREHYLIHLDGEKLILPRKEFELLDLLYKSPLKVFTRKEISKQIWGYELPRSNRTIDVHVRKLREKLGDKFIKTIKGIGYRLQI